MTKRGKSASVRLILPLDGDDHLLFKRAAELRGCSVSDYVIDAAQQEAERVLAQTKAGGPPPSLAGEH